MLGIWAANFKELLNGTEAASCLELPSLVRREVEVEEIGREEVETAMHKMKKDKATGADEVRLEMMEMAGEVGVKWTGRLLNVCMQEGRIPKEWRMGLIVPIWKRKGDVHDTGKYRGVSLLSQVLKLLERGIDARIRRRVECYFGEEQQGFRKGRGTADGMYVLRQMMEKRLEVQGSMALGFVDLEKAFDEVPREMVMATLRLMGVPEAGVRMVEGTYAKTTARVVVGEEASEEFEVKIGLRQGSVLSSLLFIAVLDLISRKTATNDVMKKLLYVDDLALVANGKQELHESLKEWNGLFTRHGLNINLEKWHCAFHLVAHRPPEGRAGQKLTQGDSFVYLGGTVCVDGKTERKVLRRAPAGANAWRAVEGVMVDRRISKRMKGNVMSTSVTPVCLYGTETLAITELQQQRLHVCENNWLRKIAGVTMADRRMMVELREETGVQRSLTERLVRSRLQWAGNVERMADDRLPKRAAELCEQGRRRRGRPRLRWNDGDKRDARKAGEEEDWNKKTRDRGGLSDEAVKKLRAAPHP